MAVATTEKREESLSAAQTVRTEDSSPESDKMTVLTVSPVAVVHPSRAWSVHTRPASVLGKAREDGGEFRVHLPHERINVIKVFKGVSLERLNLDKRVAVVPHGSKRELDWRRLVAFLERLGD